jgi:hypothetical protein
VVDDAPDPVVVPEVGPAKKDEECDADERI